MRTTSMKCLVVIKSDLLKDSTENCGWGRLLLKSLPANCKVKEDGNKMKKKSKCTSLIFFCISKFPSGSVRIISAQRPVPYPAAIGTEPQTNESGWWPIFGGTDRIKKNTVKPSMGVTAEIETTQNPNNIVNIVIKMKSSWDELVIRWPCEHWVSNMGLTWV